ncbi:MAG: hypothetical protein K5874_03360 [Bacteroidaceae bacterium]|nr:hypothetical protein [Bacteroidaceae bacterium]
MNNETINKSARFSKDNPFTVPEGYFETLTQRVMDNVRQTERANVVCITQKRRVNWQLWTCGIAACIVGALVFIQIQKSKTTDPQETSLLAEQNSVENYTYDEQYQDEEMNYAMVDYNDVYCYLSGAEY